MRTYISKTLSIVHEYGEFYLISDTKDNQEFIESIYISDKIAKMLIDELTNKAK